MTVGDTIQSVNGAGLGGVVTSVNGATGPVDVTVSAGVTSVDGNTGAVVLTGTYLALAGGTLTGLLSATKSLAVTAATSGTIGLAVVGASGQTSNLTSWLTNALVTVASVDAAGVVNGSALSVSSSAAATGGVRLPSTTQINWRNVANTGDIGGFATNASDQITAGTTVVPVSDNTKALGSSALRWSSLVSVNVSLGTNPAATGTIRLGSTAQINWRNAANSADIGGFSSNASDQIQCATTLVPSSDSAKDLGASGARWANIYGVIGVFGSATNTASAGAVRMANAAGVNWRNNGNSADIGWTVSSSDLMTTTAGVVAAHLAPASTTGATSAARYFRATASGAPVSGTWVAGDIVPAADGTFWFCTVGGTPGTWVQSGSATYATKAATTDLVDAKGDRLLGSADNTLVRHAAPANGQFSVADSAQSDGWKDIDLPWHVSIDPIRVPAYSTVGGSIAAWGTYYQMANLNDEVVYNVQLGPGTWTFSCWRTIFTSYGILTVTLDGTTIATLDNYSGASVNPGQSLTTGISITAAGVYALKLKTTGKNASSSNYNQRLWSMDFTRTA